MVVWNRENTNLRLATNDTERVTITAGGNVGIGTTLAYSRLSVHCAGANNTITKNLHLSGSHADANASPRGAAIVLGRDVTTADFTSRIWGRWCSYNDYSGELGFDIHGASSSTSYCTAMLINKSGNVGIGTTSPSAKLDVSGGTGLIVDPTNNLYGGMRIHDSSSGNYHVYLVYNLLIN